MTIVEKKMPRLVAERSDQFSFLGSVIRNSRTPAADGKTYETRRLAVMNLALRGIEADFGPEHADTFRRDLHPDLRADFVLANPPFNDSDWFRKDDDVRWQFGVPPKGNANFAWVQHFIHHLAPHGMAGFVLAVTASLNHSFCISGL